jgi:cytochrome c oxidase subunit 3
MGDEKKLKRYEPYGFLLVLGLISMLFTVAFLLFKYRLSGAPAPGLEARIWVRAGLLTLSFAFFNEVRKRLLLQHFHGLRFFVATSYGLLLLFIVWQLSAFPFNGNPEQIPGLFFLGYLALLHALFCLFPLFFLGRLSNELFKQKDYVENFIYSVNPPNVLRLRILWGYMAFITAVWWLIIVYIHVA